jgi:transposase-like protein
MAKKKARTTTEPLTLLEAIRYFKDPDNCIRYIAERRWPNGEVTCPTCGSNAVLYLKNQCRWKCGNDHARRQFTLKVGTVMEDSPIGLDKWLPAMWMIGNCKNGVSSYEISRALDVTQKTAWFMLHRIRCSMQDEGGGTIDGEVEVDETFIGGKARFMHKHKRAEKIKGTGGMGKVAVMGLLARHGHGDKEHSTVRVQVLSSRKKRELEAEVHKHVTPGAEVFTDELPSYNNLAPDYAHQVINHAEEYVRGNVHTNGVENFWSLLKRTIKGTYTSVEPFHLFRYLDEQAFRFNERKTNDAGRFDEVLRAIVGRRLTYRKLIGDEEKTEPTVAASN